MNAVFVDEHNVHLLVLTEKQCKKMTLSLSLSKLFQFCHPKLKTYNRIVELKTRTRNLTLIIGGNCEKLSFSCENKEF